MSELPHYTSWRDVPPHLMTKTQLRSLDLPRTPGKVTAYVDGYDGIGRNTTHDLYAVSESVPTKATAKQLQAARARGGEAQRYCADCYGRPELPCTTPYDGDRFLCATCAHIHRLRAAQKAAREDRRAVAVQAWELLADERLAVVHVTLTERGTTPSGVKRSPSAAHLVALDNKGGTLVDVTVRLVGPRSAGIPAGAIAPEDAVDQIRAALTGRALVVWGTEAIGVLAGALHQQGMTPAIPVGYGVRTSLERLVLGWRCDINPRTYSPRPAIAPGRADRMLLLLQHIAAHHTPATTPEELS